MTLPRPRCTFFTDDIAAITTSRRAVIGTTAAVSLGAIVPRLPFATHALAQDASPTAEGLSLGFDEIATGFEKPLLVTHAGDSSGRLFVVEQVGRVRIVSEGQVVTTPFLDITDRVGSSGNEQGLLGLTFAPDYASSGLLYVNYTDTDGNTVVSRFTASDDANAADPASELVILQQKQPFSNHNGGNLVFGPDGYLHVGFGDGGSQGDPNGNGQNLDTWLGKILRIDVTDASSDAPYIVPADNPFVSTADAKPEILFYGLRNPWRFSFDRETGDIWIGDVGQNEWEEIDHVPADAMLNGINFGWNIMEGETCYNAESCNQDGLTLPVFTYSHTVGGCSVTGGYVYRGSVYPPLTGTYLCGDYCSGLIWGIVSDGNGGFTASTPVDSGFAISSFGEDEAGELYVIDQNTGSVHHITANQ